MWREYSADYIKQNRSSGLSIVVAAFIAALFLSFLCSLFYNFWLDNVEGTKMETGDWHGRITGAFHAEDLELIEQFANVEKAVVNEELSGEQKTTVDVLFFNKRTVYRDMEAIRAWFKAAESDVTYNYQLLSLYFIRIPGDSMPRLLMPAYLAVVLIVCVSLILVIHNSFAVSMDSRVHQFGIFSSIGATPGQIRICLLQEAFLLCAAPIFVGLLAGIALSFGTMKAMGMLTAELVGGRQVNFYWHPAVFAGILFLSFLTVLISAWIPANRLSRLTPLEAIKGTAEMQLKKKKRSPILTMLFGVEGELAGNGLKARKKALRTTSLSLMLAFFGFMMMQCFFTLSGISTDYTYFKAYQDVWDVMTTVKDTKIEAFGLTAELKELPGADNTVLYQKAEALCRLPKDAESEELKNLGGVTVFGEEVADDEADFRKVKASVIILDDESFKEFCGQVGIAPRIDGAILLNRIWDSIHSNFRYPQYIPYVREDLDTVVLHRMAAAGEAGQVMDEKDSAKVPVLACTDMTPALREEYGKSDHDLVHFIPLSLWREISGKVGGAEPDCYIRALAGDRTSPEALCALEDEIIKIVGQTYEVESENRIQEKLDNDKMIAGYELVLGGFCVLLAIIGIAHVFSNTQGFLRQRKKEFARYMSIGLTPRGMWKIFCIEALVTVGRPMFLTLVLTIMAMAVMIKASNLNALEFILVAPVLPILTFIFTVFGFVALAYFLGGRKLSKCELAKTLRGDSMSE